MQRALAPLGPCLSGDPALVAAALIAGVDVLHLHEAAEADGAPVAAAACAQLGLPAVVVDLPRLSPDNPSLLLREVRLRGGVLAVRVPEPHDPAQTATLRALTAGRWPVAVCTPGSWNPAWSDQLPLAVSVPTPDHARRLRGLTALLGHDLDLPGPLHLRPDQLARVADAAVMHAAAECRRVSAEDVAAAARCENGVALERYATRIIPEVARSDLVVDVAVSRELDELVRRTRWRHAVLDEWNLGRLVRHTRGVSALFAGPPGTGKTMAAEVLARELGVDLYVVNLAAVVDKYIGETEKNLDRIFAAAEQGNGLLLFDEADALFGKRSEVSSSYDRYANVEIAFLLQRMERFAGVAVLTTNLRGNVDPAFLRRLDAVIEFREPTARERLRLWQSFLGDGVPKKDDVDLDGCAERFTLSGGHIRNAALAAAFAAAAEQRPVQMADIVRGVAREFTLLGRMCHPTDFGHWFSQVDPQAGHGD